LKLGIKNFSKMILLLVSYFIFLIGFAIFSAAGIYHLWRFGYIGDLTQPAIIFYIVVSAGVIALTIVAICFRSWPITF